MRKNGQRVIPLPGGQSYKQYGIDVHRKLASTFGKSEQKLYRRIIQVDTEQRR